jgi:hypothetical protein
MITSLKLSPLTRRATSLSTQRRRAYRKTHTRDGAKALVARLDLRRVILGRVIQAFERVFADPLRHLDRLFRPGGFDIYLSYVLSLGVHAPHGPLRDHPRKLFHQVRQFNGPRHRSS